MLSHKSKESDKVPSRAWKKQLTSHSGLPSGRDCLPSDQYVQKPTILKLLSMLKRFYEAKIVKQTHFFYNRIGASDPWRRRVMDKKIRAEFFSRRFSGMHHTIWGRNGKELDDDLFRDVNPMNYEVCVFYEKIASTVDALSHSLIILSNTFSASDFLWLTYSPSFFHFSSSY